MMLHIRTLSKRNVLGYSRIFGLTIIILLTFVGGPLAFQIIQGAWDSSDIPVRYKKHVPSSMYDAIDAAALGWSAVEPSKFQYEAYGGFGPLVDVVLDGGIGTYSKAFIYGYTVYDEPNLFRITSADIIIDTGYNWWVDAWTQGPVGRPNLNTAMLHEFGHALGLEDSGDTSAVMLHGVHQVVSHERRSISPDDKAGLRYIYGQAGIICEQNNKPAIANTYRPGQGLINWHYVTNLASSEGLIDRDSGQGFVSLGRKINDAIDVNPMIRTKADRLAENLARDMHASLSDGNGYAIPLTASRLKEIDAFIETLESQGVIDFKLNEFRNLLQASEGRSFWSLFSDIAYNKTITVPALHQNTPNPFNPNTVIDYEVPENAYVRIQVYNLTGQLVRTLMSQNVPMGKNRVAWDGKDDSGRAVGTGVYIYRFEIPSLSYVNHKKMALLR